jgi:hypothetical protein
MPPFRDRIHRALIYAPINSGEMAGSGGATSEFGHEDIANDCTHCGVCPWCRRRVGGYEQGVQDRSASLVRTKPNSHQGRGVEPVAARLTTVRPPVTRERNYSPLAALQPAGVSIVENAFPASTSQPCSLAYR